MSAVINLDSSDDDNEVEEVIQSRSETKPSNTPKLCLNPMGHLAKSQGFIKEFVDLMNLCFQFESTEGMERILTRNLIPNYKQLDKEYVKSEKFKNFLNIISTKLKKYPEMKYSCLKQVSDNMKLNKMKKRVDLVTLNTTVSDKFQKVYKKNQENVIVLDEKEDPHPQIIDLDDEQNDVVFESCESMNNISNNGDIENIAVISSRNKTEINHKDQKKNDYYINCKENITSNNNVNIDVEKNTNETDDSQDTVLIPTNKTINIASTNLNENPSEDINTDSEEIISQISSINNSYKSTNYDFLNISTARTIEEQKTIYDIKALELEIKSLKLLLIKLEESEVLNDNFYSPYMEAHKTKLSIITKYKKICELRGEAFKPKKCRELQLQVKEGHPAGPARKLEEWLNKNIDKNGEPSLPNLRDVIKCVWMANQEDQLGWDINRSYQEARILFDQCGQHLQKRRQQREWRDMLQTVRAPLDQDPADSDPELLAKLEANKQLARTKFEGIIDYYAKLEEDSRKKNKRIKITNVQSLSNTKPESSWEVPITGLINVTPTTQSENNKEQNIDIKTKIVEESAYNSSEINNQVDILNKYLNLNNSGSEEPNYTENGVFKNNQASIQKDSTHSRVDNTSHAVSLKTYQKLSITEKSKKLMCVVDSSTDFETHINHNSNNSSVETNLPNKNTLHKSIDIPYNPDHSVLRKLKNIKSNVEKMSVDSVQTSLHDIEAPKNQNSDLLTETTYKLSIPNETKSEPLISKDCDDILRSHLNDKLDSNTKTAIEKNYSQQNMETEDITKHGVNQSIVINKPTDSPKIEDSDSVIRNVDDGKVLNNDKDNENDIPKEENKIKSEIKMEVDFSEEDFDLLLDNFSADATASLRVFDVEDTVVFIELSSSESESDDDDCQLITL